MGGRRFAEGGLADGLRSGCGCGSEGLRMMGLLRNGRRWSRWLRNKWIAEGKVSPEQEVSEAEVPEADMDSEASRPKLRV